MSNTPPLAIGCALLFCVAASQAQTIVIDDFENGEGHFTSAPSASGSTHGEIDGASTAELADSSITAPFAGQFSQEIFLDDDPNADEAGSNPLRTWQARLLSGGGAIANNVALQNNAEAYVGFFLKTTTPNLLASLMLDDTTLALERARFLPVINDGEWHLYEWKISDANDWEPFALAEANGEINSPTVTIDSLFISALKDSTISDQDAVFYIDNVSFNPEGHVQIPEPASLSLIGMAAVGVLGLRRRR